ncbi:MAG TPA: 3-oxoacyl-ACP reductase family protein [Oscillospiraceae bacterium]|nr:3-oxoacyl-ACP reductase family protein [Oscillospiraceae bacterium]
MRRFEGKVVLITGAPGGLGSAQARRFASEGASVALNYVNMGNMAELAEALAAELTSEYGGTHKAYEADISTEAPVQAMVARIVEDFGHIDVLVNNAGISMNYMSWKYPEDKWRKVLDVNLFGAFFCAKAVLPHMRAQQFGRIVNISSVVGITGSMGTVAYGTAKAGMIGMSVNIAREVATRGITINCVAPGYVDAGIMSDVPDAYRNETVIPGIPMGHLGAPEDIANAVTFLAAPESGYITGAVLRVDGGYAL